MFAELAESAMCSDPSLAQNSTGGQVVPTERAQSVLFAVEEDCERMQKIISEMGDEREVHVTRMANLRFEAQTANNLALKLQTKGSAELQEAERRIQRAQEQAQAEVQVANMMQR